MSAKRIRITAFLVLANYLLALTVGGSFHVHGDHQRARDSGHSASVCSHDAAGLPGGDSVSHAGYCAAAHTATEGARLVSSRSEKCPVCQFLTQKPVPGRVVQTVAFTELVDGWVPVHPVPLVDHVPSAHPIRGPPAVA